MHYYKRHLGDYAKKAGRLSMLEHGAYTLLIDSCYDRERFPTKEEAIKWCWARTKEEVAAVEFVLSQFFDFDGEFYTQARIQEEIDSYHEKAITNKRIALEREEQRRAKRARTEHEPCTNGHESPPNHKPLTTNQEPLKEPLLSSDDDLGSSIKLKKQESPKLSATECQEIADHYNLVLGGLIGNVSLLTTARQSSINARYREMLNSKNQGGETRFTDKQGGIRWFKAFFGHIARSNFLIGENDRGWKANFDWILKPANFIKIVEGGYLK